MARVSKETLKSYFELGDVPTQNEFADLIDSLALQEDLETLEGEAGDQASDINDLEGMIHAVVTKLGGIIRRVDVDMIDGYYLSNAESPSLVENGAYQITRPIQLSAGETVVLRCNQGGVSAIAITNASASVFTRVVSGSSSKKVYMYTATEDTYVSLCGQKSLFQFAVVTLNVVEKLTELESRTSKGEDVDDFLLNPRYGFELIQGQYIKMDGSIGNSSAFSYTRPFRVAEGETLVFWRQGTGCAGIVNVDSDGNILNVLSQNAPGSYSDTEPTLTEYIIGAGVEYISLCSVTSAFETHPPFIAKGVIDRIADLEKKNSTIEQNIDTIEQNIDTIEQNIDTNNISINDNIFVGESQRVYGKLVLYINTGTREDVYLADFAQGKCYRILLKNNTTYYLPHSSGLFGNAYNFLVAGDNGEAYPTLKFGGDDGALIGGGITRTDNYLSFTSPAEGNNYLFINLEYIPSETNVVDRFYLTSNPDYAKVAIPYNKLSYQGIYITLSEYITQFINISNKYGNKVIYVLGDSITWLGGDNCDGVQGNYDHQGWTEYVKNALKPKVMKSYARSGATLSCYTNSVESTTIQAGSPSPTNILWNQVIRMVNDINNGAELPDYIFIAAGCNDAYVFENTSSALAEQHANAQNFLSDDADAVMTSAISTSWYGSKTPAECDSITKTLRWMKDVFTTICPNVQVVLMTPLQSHFSSLSVQRQVSERMKECAIYLSWNTIDQGKECGISRLQESKGYHFTYDGTHTSRRGAEHIGNIIAKLLQSMLG